MLSYIMPYSGGGGKIPSCNKSFQEHISVCLETADFYERRQVELQEKDVVYTPSTYMLPLQLASARAAVPTNVINTMLLYHFRCSAKYI